MDLLTKIVVAACQANGVLQTDQAGDGCAGAMLVVYKNQSDSWVFIQDTQAQDATDRDLGVPVHLNVPEQSDWPSLCQCLRDSMISSYSHERSSPVSEDVDRSAEEVDVLQIHWRLAVGPLGHEISPPSSPEKYTISIAT